MNARSSRNLPIAVASVLLLAGCASAGGRNAVAYSRPAPPPVKRLRDPDPALRGLIGFRVRYRDLRRRRGMLVRTVAVPYRAWDGTTRLAVVVLPRWYGRRLHPPIPLVIAPHGRGVTPVQNTRFWGRLPAFGPFAVVSPDGEGRRLSLYSWGWRGQIDDLARMPRILRAALPWLHVDRSRIYAVGSSMGGQEALLLVALHPRLLAGASALDSATDMAARYRAFGRLAGGRLLQQLARIEIGGTPATAPEAYALRSPIHYVRQLAFSGVPLHIWWSLHDRVVVDQRRESGRLYRGILAVNPEAPVTEYVGTWRHSAEMRATERLPLALVRLRLIRLDEPMTAGAGR